MASVDKYLRGAEQPLLTTNLRFFGFVNDIGEALHAYLPKSLYIGSFVFPDPRARCSRGH